MKLLITGGAGFIGTNISLEAKNRGYEVTVFDSLIRKGVESNIPVLEKHGVKIFRGDIRNQADFERLEGAFDGIIHLAGNPGIPWSIAHPLYDFQVNALGTINILEYARSHGNLPFLFASTNKTYSDFINEFPYKKEGYRYVWDFPNFPMLVDTKGISERGINEQFPTDGFGKYPHSPYGASKLAADTYCQEYFHTYGLPVVINRMSCIYGYFQQGVADQGWIDHFVRTIAFGDGKIDIFGDGLQVRDMLFGTDVAKLYLDELEAIDRVKGSIFNVGGGSANTLSLLESIDIIERLTNKKAHIEVHDWRHADQKVYISDTTKVQISLGWQPTISPKEGIKLMYEQYKKL